MQDKMMVLSIYAIITLYSDLCNKKGGIMPDKSYWQNELPHPYAPNLYDIAVYKRYLLSGSTLLLGCTHKLLEHSDVQLDIDPWYEADTVIVGDWKHNSDTFTNIIGDGVLNFTEELTISVLEMASNHSKAFICRTFIRKLPLMQVAGYFPTSNDFHIKPSITVGFDDYMFNVWYF